VANKRATKRERVRQPTAMAALTKKLKKWGASLPDEEKQLLTNILDRGKGIGVSEEPIPDSVTKVVQITESLFPDSLQQPGRVIVDVGPVWLKRNGWLKQGGDPWIRYTPK
jgi:hypothetical protein